MSSQVRQPQRCPWLIAGLLAASAVALFIVALPKRTTTPEDSARNPRGGAPPHGPISIELDPQELEAAARALSPADDGRALDLERLVAGFERAVSKPGIVALGLVCGAYTLPELTEPDGAPISTHPQALALREQVLRRAIERAPARLTIAAAIEFSRGAPVELRRVLFGVLGALDDEGALDGLVETARDVEAVHWQRDYVAGPFETALLARLAARPESVHRLRAQLRELDEALITVVARAAARLPNTLALEFALDLLGRESEADLAVLQALASAPSHAALACDEASLAGVRRMLEASDPRVRRAAIDVCGRLADAQPVEWLIAELEGSDAVLQQAARRALVSIAGVDHGHTAQAWTRWLAQEREWREREWASLVTQLERGDRGRALAAMRALVGHPLHRVEAAELIWAACESSERLGPVELGVLASTRAPLAIEAMLLALERDDPELVEAASAALSRLTGLAAPENVTEWRARLGR